MGNYQNAFIFHGTAGSPDGNWFPWLKDVLESHNIPTAVPRFPTPVGESLQAWFDVLDSLDQKIETKSLLVGHSKGGMFLLKVLERLSEPVDTVVIVAAPIGIKPLLYYEADRKFTNFDFDWNKIRSSAKHFVVFQSDNDPYVSLANGERIAKNLGVDLTFIPDAGHINADSNYFKFPEILTAIDIENKLKSVYDGPPKMHNRYI